MIEDAQTLPAISTTDPEKYWIQMHGGNPFVYGSVDNDVSIHDIAHHLSLVCRFSGATTYHYSVAQHSVMVAQAVDQRDPLLRMYALLHDAHESVLGDIPTPASQYLASVAGYDWVEYIKLAADEAILTQLGLTYPVPSTIKAKVKVADIQAFVTEASQILQNVPYWLDRYPYKPLDVRIEPMTPGAAKELFIREYNSISKALGLATRTRNDRTRKTAA